MILDFFLNNPTAAYILCIATVLFAFVMSANVNSTFKKYSRVMSRRGVSANVVVRQILDANGLYDVQVARIAGNLTDNYNPRTNTISLSAGVFDSCSVASIGVAAHEAGHAVQYARGYFPIKLRNLILPAAQLGSYAWVWVLILGIAFSMPILVEVGIVLFACIFIFQLVTLPVEFNASRRALSTLGSEGILDSEETGLARKVLSAAAMTYVASVLVSLAQLIRLLARSNRR